MLDRPSAAGRIGTLEIVARRPVLIAALLYLVSIAVCVALAGAPFVYPLDDAYIHMALARTLAGAGVWGVQPNDPAAASSSPLWTVLLTLRDAVKPPSASLSTVWTPLIVNGIAGVALIGLWGAILKRNAAWFVGAWPSPVLLAMVLLTGLTAQSLLGMEHVLHLLLATALVWWSARAIAEDDAVISPVAIGALSLFAVAARYESLFVVAPLVVFAGLRRKFGVAAALILGAVAPVLLFGLYWTRHGGWMLPNSLLIKAVNPAQASGASGFIAGVLRNLASNISNHKISTICLGLMSVTQIVLAASYLRRRRSIVETPVIMVGAALCATVLQFLLASIGWLYRYEAWLIGLGLVTIALLIPPRPAPREHASADKGWLLIALLTLTIGAMGVRAIRQLNDAVKAVDDRREEHLSVARFLRTDYAGETVMINDLGLAAYYGRARLLDLYGLGDNEPVRLRRAGGYGEPQVAKWAADQGASAAILQICWNEVWSRTPSAWRLVEVWRIPRNTVFGDHDIGFFAINPAAAPALVTALHRFRPPPKVEVVHPAPDEWPRFLAAARAGHPASSGSALCTTGAGAH